MATRREALSELLDDLDVGLGHPRAQYLRYSADAVRRESHRKRLAKPALGREPLPDLGLGLGQVQRLLDASTVELFRLVLVLEEGMRSADHEAVLEDLDPSGIADDGALAVAIEADRQADDPLGPIGCEKVGASPLFAGDAGVVGNELGLGGARSVSRPETS